MLGWPEILVLASAAVIALSWRKLPDAAKGMKKALGIFQKEIKGEEDPRQVREVTPLESSGTKKGKTE